MASIDRSGSSRFQSVLAVTLGPHVAQASAVQRAIDKFDDIPNGVFSLLHGTTPAIAGDLVTRPAIKVRNTRAKQPWYQLGKSRCYTTRSM